MDIHKATHLCFENLFEGSFGFLGLTLAQLKHQPQQYPHSVLTVSFLATSLCVS